MWVARKPASRAKATRCWVTWARQRLTAELLCIADPPLWVVSSAELAGHALAPVGRGVRLAAVLVQGLQQRRVVDGEEQRRVGPVVEVLVGGPARDHEHVPGRPREAEPVDDGRARALERQVHGASGMPVRARVDT